MPQLFKAVAPLMKQLRGDLTTRIYPSLLTSLATATKVELASTLADAAGKTGGKSPPLTMSVSMLPIPGSSLVKTVFLVSGDPEAGQRSTAEAEAYKKSFRTFFKERLGSKAMVLKLLSSVGVT